MFTHKYKSPKTSDCTAIESELHFELSKMEPDSTAKLCSLKLFLQLLGYKTPETHAVVRTQMNIFLKSHLIIELYYNLG